MSRQIEDRLKRAYLANGGSEGIFETIKGDLIADYNRQATIQAALEEGSCPVSMNDLVRMEFKNAGSRNDHAEIDQLNHRWKRYGPIMPRRPGQQTGMGRYDPSVFLQKNELSIAIDQKQIELAQLKRQRAEQELAAYDVSGALSAAETAHQDAERALEEAKRSLQVAQMEYSGAWDQLQRQQERHARLITTMSQYEAEGQRWTDELERDRILRSNAGGDRDEAA